MILGKGQVIGFHNNYKLSHFLQDFTTQHFYKEFLKSEA